MIASERIVTLCTGNAARSVMLGFMLSTLAELNGERWEVRTAGTHAVEGLAMSQRTLEALGRIDELADHRFTAHRSHQLTDEDVEWSTLILTAEADHVAYVRARYPFATLKVVQLGAFCRFAPLDGSVADRTATVAMLGADDAYDVADPAGLDQMAYDACADELWSLAQVFATLAAGDPLAG